MGSIILLSMLTVLHVFWFYLFGKILITSLLQGYDQKKNERLTGKLLKSEDTEHFLRLKQKMLGLTINKVTEGKRV